MSNVPTITPGPDDSGHAPESATETLPLITSAPTAQQNDNEQACFGISDDEPTQSSRPSAPNGDTKSSSAAALRQES